MGAPGPLRCGVQYGYVGGLGWCSGGTPEREGGREEGRGVGGEGCFGGGALRLAQEGGVCRWSCTVWDMLLCGMAIIGGVGEGGNRSRGRCWAFWLVSVGGESVNRKGLDRTLGIGIGHRDSRV